MGLHQCNPMRGPLGRSENGVAPVHNGVALVQNGFRMVQKTLERLLPPELKLPFAPSPNHFWEFTIFGLSPRTFGLQSWFFLSRFKSGWTVTTKAKKELYNQILNFGSCFS